jgi:hypothetical protein
VGTLIKSTCSSEQVLFYFSPSQSARGWAKAKNKKAPSERSEEVLLIHCTSPTTGSPTDREVILSHAAAMRKEERENRARARGSWAKRMLYCSTNLFMSVWTSALCVSKTNAPLSFEVIHERSELVNSALCVSKTNALLILKIHSWAKQTTLQCSVLSD